MADNRFDDQFGARFHKVLLSGQFSKTIALVERFQSGRLSIETKMRNLIRDRVINQLGVRE